MVYSIDRRKFLQTTAIAVSVGAAAGLTKFIPYDPYDKFLRNSR
jgi:hypothetical protein